MQQSAYKIQKLKSCWVVWQHKMCVYCSSPCLSLCVSLIPSKHTSRLKKQQQQCIPYMHGRSVCQMCKSEMNFRMFKNSNAVRPSKESSTLLLSKGLWTQNPRPTVVQFWDHENLCCLFMISSSMDMNFAKEWPSYSSSLFLKVWWPSCWIKHCDC